ncbi:Ig-like domain-containing protein [Deltaproteobacteria bacterium TL4]
MRKPCGEGGGTAGNGLLEGGETDTATYVCNGATGTTGFGTTGAAGAKGDTGANGYTTLIKSSTANAPALCPNGGLKVDSGLDNGDGGGTANNGILEEVEVDATSYVCNGATGDKGAPSTSGYNTLLTITTEIPGGNCTSGGKKLESGLDNGDGGGTASNGTLESGELDYFTYVCNGTDTTPPLVSSTNPKSYAIGADVTASISMTFNEAMNTATITTNTSDTTCSVSIQLSSDSFTTCVPMSVSPVASDKDKTFTVTPASSLSTSTRYKIRVTTFATDYTGNALAYQYTQTAGFLKNEVLTISVSRGDGQNTLIWSSVTGAASYNLYWSATTGVTTSNGTKISGVTVPTFYGSDQWHRLLLHPDGSQYGRRK